MPLTLPATILAFAFDALPAQLTGEFLEYAILFFVLAIVAAVLGAGNVAGVSMAIAKWLVIIFVVLAIITLLL